MVAKNILSALVFAVTCFGEDLLLFFPNLFLFLLKTSGVGTMVNAQDCARNYTVQPGDVCDKISAAQNVSTYVSISYSSFKKKGF